MSRYSLPSSERLKSSKSIAQLFRAGRSLAKYPVIIRYYIVPEGTPGFKVAFTVSKKNHRKAVDRNLIKRRMREAFRLNASVLRKMIFEKEISVEMMYIFTGKEIASFKDIQEAINHLNYHLRRKLDNSRA